MVKHLLAVLAISAIFPNFSDTFSKQTEVILSKNDLRNFAKSSRHQSIISLTEIKKVKPFAMK